MDSKSTEHEPANSRYLVQLTRKELVQVFSAVSDAKKATVDPEMRVMHEGILSKLAQSQENGPVPICEVHQIPMVRMKGKHGTFWSCHQKDEAGEWCQYRPS